MNMLKIRFFDVIDHCNREAIPPISYMFLEFVLIPGRKLGFPRRGEEGSLLCKPWLGPHAFIVGCTFSAHPLSSSECLRLLHYLPITADHMATVTFTFVMQI